MKICPWCGKKLRLKHDKLFCKCGYKPVQTKRECSYWTMRQKGRTDYPYKEHWRDCDACQDSDPTGTATGRPADSRRVFHERTLLAKDDPAEQGRGDPAQGGQS